MLEKMESTIVHSRHVILSKTLLFIYEPIAKNVFIAVKQRIPIRKVDGLRCLLAKLINMSRLYATCHLTACLLYALNTKLFTLS